MSGLPQPCEDDRGTTYRARQMKQPLVSVMMPCYNAAESLPWALGSMLAQTYTRWELIVVDDGSTDGSAAAIEALGDPRIRLIRFPENRGRPHARQAALDAAQGEYLAMLDADDWIYPEKLERQTEVLERCPELAAVGAGVMVADGDWRPFGVQAAGGRGGGVEEVSIPRLGPLPLGHAPTVVRMDVARQVRYNVALRIRIFYYVRLWVGLAL